jgi:PAS domain S-box-containing protein
MCVNQGWDEHFRNLADTMPGQIWMSDPSGGRFHFNRAWTDFRGRTIEQEIGEGWMSGIHEGDLPAVMSMLRSADETQLPFSHEYRICGADAQHHWLYEYARPRFGKDGNFQGFIGEAVDITHRKHIEAELREAVLAAESANRAKSAFLANTTHELRTPMTSILGFSELFLMRRQQLGPEVTHFAELIHGSGTRLLTLINDILDLSRIESGGLRIVLRPCDPMAMVNDVVESLQYQAQQKGLTLTCEFDGQIPGSIESDSARLKQILTNLIENALKFTSDGGVRVIVRRAHADALLFSVVDTGIGIMPQQHERLFKPFSQGDDSISRRYGGTGLGLSISRGLAQLLGGNVVGYSAAGIGSCFTLELGAAESTCSGCPLFETCSLRQTDAIDARRCA